MSVSADGLLRWKHSDWDMAESDWWVRSPAWMTRPSDAACTNWRRGCISSQNSASAAKEQGDRLPRRNPPLSLEYVMQLVELELAGEPDSQLLWVRRSLRKLQRALDAVDLGLSPNTISRILQDYSIRPKANAKHLMPRSHPDRDRNSATFS